MKGRCRMNGVDKDDNPMRITRWLYAKGKEFSGHARGGPITGEAWCLCEVEALAKKGVKVRMVHHPALAGYVALERC